MFDDAVAPAVRKAIIRTSDRSAYKHCRRVWGWQSGIKQNLQIKDTPSYFWIGSGGHFAMEDYHGYNHYQHPVEAFRAYVEACRICDRKNGYGLPADWKEQTELAEGILEYYLIWSQERFTPPTVWLDGIPQVEIKCEIPLTPHLTPRGLDALEASEFDEVVYQFTLDRLVEIDSEYWIQDWKFYKSFSGSDLDMDQQMGAYIWAANAIFDRPIVGAILHEFRKDLANTPKILASGLLSVAENQKTTHRLYREALVRIYGEVENATNKHILRLNDYAQRETADRDDFIRRSFTRRNEGQQRSTGSTILMEVEEMLDPHLPLYPNPKRDCSFCDFRDVCLEVDRDEDWQTTLNDITVSRTKESDEWRHHLKAV